MSVLLLCVSFTACKKGQVASPALSGAKLVLVSEKDLAANGTDTTLISSYAYDAKNRIVLQVDSTPGSAYTYKTRYTYDADGNILTMYVNNATSPSYTYFNTNGKPATSFLGGESTQPWSNFTITNNKVTAVTYAGFNYGITYTGNNFNVIINNIGGSDVVKRTFSYGTKKSPFYVGGFKYFLGDYPPYSQIEGQNEVLQRVDENTNAATGTFTFSYDYNSDNYPVRAADYKNGVLTGYQLFSYTTAQ